MKFLFYIACLVCVSSLPISLIPEPQSLVELGTSWPVAPSEYENFAHNKFCDQNDAGTNAPLSNDKTLANKGLCQARCEGQEKCNFFLWREDDCTCATFRFCEDTSDFGGEDSDIYKRHWVKTVAHNKFCDTSHHQPLSNDKTLETIEECEARCEGQDGCRFFLWREDDCTCATFRFCGKASPNNDYEGSYIYKRHWVSPDDEEYDNQYQSPNDWVLNDEYCCNYNYKKKCSRNVLILHTEGEGADLAALWGSEDNCKASCASDLTCNFYMYRWKGSLRTCATFRTCKKKNRKGIYNNDGTSCVYKKHQG